MERELPAISGAPRMARRAVADGLSELPRELIDTVKLLVSELVTNSLRHAGLGPDDSVRLSLQVRPDRIHVEVADPGPGFQPQGLRPDVAEGPTFGLALVDGLADAWGVRDDPCSVWFDVTTASDGPGPAARSG